MGDVGCSGRGLAGRWLQPIAPFKDPRTGRPSRKLTGRDLQRSSKGGSLVLRLWSGLPCAPECIGWCWPANDGTGGLAPFRFYRNTLAATHNACRFRKKRKPGPRQPPRVQWSTPSRRCTFFRREMLGILQASVAIFQIDGAARGLNSTRATRCLCCPRQRQCPWSGVCGHRVHARPSHLISEQESRDEKSDVCRNRHDGHGTMLRHHRSKWFCSTAKTLGKERRGHASQRSTPGVRQNLLGLPAYVRHVCKPLCTPARGWT